MTGYSMKLLLLVFFVESSVNFVLCQDKDYKYYRQILFQDVCPQFRQRSSDGYPELKFNLSIDHQMERPQSGGVLFSSPSSQQLKFLIDQKCEFLVRPSSEHLLINIEKMSFQTSEWGYCIDYVEIEYVHKHGGYYMSQRFCGEVNGGVSSSAVSTTGIHASNAGNIKVTIFISKDNVYKNLENSLVIVFTPIQYQYDVNERYNNIETESISGTPGSYHTIEMQKEYLCDGIKNCAENECSDEKNCHMSLVWFCSIFCVLFIVGLSYFCYRKDIHASITSDVSQRYSYPDHPDIISNYEVNEVDDTISVIYDGVLPPSYEFLFPNSVASPSSPSPTTTTTTTTTTTESIGNTSSQEHAHKLT